MATGINKTSYDSIQQSLKNIQSLFDVSSHNIANAHREDHTRVVAVLEEDKALGGAKIASIEKRYDLTLVKTILENTSIVQENEYMDQVLSKLCDSIGRPDSFDEGLLSSLNSFLVEFDDLSANPSSRSAVCQSATKLAKSISEVSQETYQSMSLIDEEIVNTITAANSVIDKLHNCGATLLSYKKGTIEYSTTLDAIQSGLKELSNYFEVKHYYDSNGMLNVAIKGNEHKVVGPLRYKLCYSPPSSLTEYINDSAIEGIYITAEKGSIAHVSFGGNSHERSHNIVGGKLKAMLTARDELLPAFLRSLDSFTSNLAKTFNEVHNQGVGARAAEALIGTNFMTPATVLQGEGKVLITVVNNEGNPIQNGSDFIPGLQLDLGRFRSSDVSLPKSFNLQGLTDEISRYFSNISCGSTVKFGSIYDLKLASLSKNWNEGADALLDFDVTVLNKSNQPAIDLKVEAIRASTQDGNIEVELFSPTIHLLNGEMNRTYDQKLYFKLKNLPDKPQYNISVDVAVYENDVLQKATLNYTIINPLHQAANLNGLCNVRYSIESATSKNSIEINKGKRGSSVLELNLLDEFNQKINGSRFSTTPVRTELRAMENGIAIKGDGVLTGTVNDAELLTKTRFSSFFGLNDLFVITKADPKKKAEWYGGYRNASLNIAMRQDILEDNSLFSIGTAQPYKLRGLANAPDFFYSVGVGDVSLLPQYKTAKTNITSFKKNGLLVNSSTTLSGYIQQIISATKAKLDKVQADKNLAQNKCDAASDKLSGRTGVNISTEAMLASQYQITHDATVKLYEAMKEMHGSIMRGRV